MSFQLPHDDLITEIRQQPAAFVGDTGQAGLHALFYEAIGYSLKEALVKHCTQLEITLDYDQKVIIRDNSPGIDTKIVDAIGTSLLEIKLTRRSTDRHLGMEVHPLYGVGLPVVNALSQMFTAEVRRDGYLWRQEYCYGEKQTPVMRVRALQPSESRGVMLTFKPDSEIFGHQSFDYANLALRLRTIAFLVPDLTITLKDERIGLRDHFHHPAGLLDFARFYNRGQIMMHNPMYGVEEIEMLTPGSWSYTVRAEIAVQYILSGEGTERIYVNTMRTQHPTAARAMRAGLLWGLNRYARRTGILSRTDGDLKLEDISVGITVVVSIFHLYTSTGNQKLNQILQRNTWDATLRAAINAVGIFERTHPNDMRKIIDQIRQRRHW